MDADLYTIRLNRKIIRDSAEHENNNKKPKDFFATDYFDVLKVEKKELDKPFTEIMGIWPDEVLDVDDVAIQSYSLYCSSQMISLEEKEPDIVKEKCGNPFNTDAARQMSYLSIIHVHITPEIIAHALKDKSVQEFMDCILEDLRSIIRGFIKNNEKEKMVYRIYKMLSAGDFAVVINSDDVETSFKISTLIRQRVAVDNTIESQNDTRPIIIYKTYTLLTIDGSVIQEEGEVTDGQADKQTSDKTSGCFVLRCGYSNLYWSRSIEIEKNVKSRLSMPTTKIYGLNGRYDFSVIISSEEFKRLFHYIDEYKRGKSQEDNSKLSEWNLPPSDKSIDIVDYIKYLMKNNCLSCINERYLQQELKGQNTTVEGVSEHITLENGCIRRREDFLDSKIADFYKQVSDNYEDMRKEISKINGYRKNMEHYLNLLEKLVKLCYGINGSSDTRIFAAVLLEQLDIIIDSIRIYTDILVEESEGDTVNCPADLLDLLEDYIRESVCVLDSYAQYIRNNNLQSLQTPNYDIESNTSMEKILIGYSELLQIFIDFYREKQRDIDGNKEKNMYENVRQYLPVVVPVLSRRDVSVEVLFPEGNMDDWDKEKAIRKDKKNRFCMAITTPTLTELGYVMTMATSLFHEVAHQFRYETRQERNDALLQYCVHRMMHCLTVNLLDQLRKKLGFVELTRDYETKIEKYFIEAYLAVNYGKTGEGEFDYKYQNVPLNNFVRNLVTDTHKNLMYWGKEEEIKLAYHEFVKTLSVYYHSDDYEYAGIIDLLDKLINQLIESKDDKEERRYKISKCAFVFSYKCACSNILAPITMPWGEISYADWVRDENEILFQNVWNENFNGLIGDERDYIKKIWNAFFTFDCWLYDRPEGDSFDNRQRVAFLEDAYVKMCAGWEKEPMREDFLNDPNSNLEKLGRMLGIDCNCEMNKRVFEKYVEAALIQSLEEMKIIAQKEIEEYREETADLFMCNVMQLTPFGYLHLLAINWPNDAAFAEAHLNRCMDVLLFQWCINSEGNLDSELFRKVSMDIIEELDHSITSIENTLSGSTPEPKAAPGCDINEMSGQVDTDEAQIIEQQDRLMKLIARCRQALKCDDTSLEKNKRRSLRFYVTIAEFLIDLIEREGNQRRYLEEHRVLQEDYKKGALELKKLFANVKDEEVKGLFAFCKEIAMLLNEPHLQYENIQNYAEFNKTSIEFLLNMYYQNKRRNAQKVGGFNADSGGNCP